MLAGELPCVAGTANNWCLLDDKIRDVLRRPIDWGAPLAIIDKQGGLLGIIDSSRLLKTAADNPRNFDATMRESLGRSLRDGENDVIHQASPLSDVVARCFLGGPSVLRWLAVVDEMRRFLGFISALEAFHSWLASLSGSGELDLSAFPEELTYGGDPQDHARDALLILRECREVLEGIYDGVYITDHQGVTLYVNPAWERITGIPISEVIGKNVREFLGKGYFSRICTPSVVTEKRPVTVLQRLRNGKYVVCSGSPIFDPEGKVRKVVTSVRDITELADLRWRLASKPDNERLRPPTETSMIAESEAMKRVLRMAEAVAPTDANVLITGESGTGKGLLASYIHEQRRRSARPFLPVNCAAVPESLLESELFGYESGAFTGASRGGKAGLFELADGGTVFLDEVGEMSPNMQAKLLRFLDTKEFIRVGGHGIRKADVRIIAATNKDLVAASARGQFRLDLYWRLATVPINLPPLRERREDIEPLAQHVLAEMCAKYGVSKAFSRDALRAITQYYWPGNIRQLRNVVERCVILCQEPQVDLQDLPDEIRHAAVVPVGSRAGSKLREVLSSVERQIYLEMYQEHGSTHKVARVLGVSQSTAARKIREYLKEMMHH